MKSLGIAIERPTLEGPLLETSIAITGIDLSHLVEYLNLRASLFRYTVISK